MLLDSSGMGRMNRRGSTYKMRQNAFEGRDWLKKETTRTIIGLDHEKKHRSD